MTLYHFCADRHIKGILHNGLTEGGLTEITPHGFILHTGWIWLTTDPDAKKQSWATRNAIQYSRTAWRLTVEIPDNGLDRIYDRQRLRAIYPLTEPLFEGWPGSENWCVHHGRIPREYIKAYERSL